MTNVSKILASLSFLSLLTLVSVANAAVSTKYDLCDGVFPSGGLSTKAQNYTVRAVADSSNGTPGKIVLHLNGTTNDIIFDSTFQGDNQVHYYTGLERSGDKSTAKLEIRCDKAGDRYCKAEFTTNISGSEQTYKLGCLVDKVDYSSPTDQNQCRPHHCR